MHIPYAAILAAAVASYIAGSLWYMALGTSWRAALGWAETGEPYRPAPLAMIVAFVADLAMATALSGVLFHLGSSGLRRSMIAAALIWAGFVLPSLATAVMFQKRSPRLILIDGGHWLLVLLVIGAVLGVMT